MELSEEQESLTKCYKFEHQIFNSLNIEYNVSNSLTVLWNTYQIFVYEDLNFEKIWKMFVPEFQTRKLIISSNYLVCLDNNDKIHTSSLKFKNPAQKRFKSSFQERGQHVLACTLIQDSILSLKYESDKYFLCSNKINTDFTLEKLIELKYIGRWPLPDPVQKKCLITSYKLDNEEIDCIMGVFGIQHDVNINDCYLVVISLDNSAVYSCLYNPKSPDADIVLVKLYTCPAEICNIEIIKRDKLFILIGLTIGTIIKCALNNITKGPDVVHLNTALYKCLVILDTLIYTDGDSLWKCDNPFKQNLLFTKFFVRKVKDFVRIGDKLLCTTYMNMLYVFHIDDEACSIKSVTTEKYCAAELLLNNSEYLYKIIEEMDKHGEITKRLNEEGSYVAALALSKRQDVMENFLNHNVTVYGNYEDVIRENTEVTLTENRSEYFKPYLFYILVRLSATSHHHMFNSILSNMHGDFKVHITFTTNDKVLKTTSIKLTKDFKKLNVLMPCDIKNDDVYMIIVNIKLVSSIPGAYDERQKLWLTLYRKDVALYSEHFLRVTPVGNLSCVSLKEPIECIEDTVYKTAMLQYGHLVSITDTVKFHSNVEEFSVYAKLPSNYVDVFRDDGRIHNISHLSKNNAMFLLSHLKVDEFLKSESYLYFNVCNSYVKLDIQNEDFINPTLKVSSTNMLIAFHMRNLISSLVNGDFGDCAPNKEYIVYTTYNVVENLQGEIRQCLANHQDYEEFYAFSEQFEKLVIGALPL